MLSTEKETIILFNEGEDTANILTYNGKLKSKLKKLSKDYPEEVTLERAQGQCVSYTIPKKWIRIVAPPTLSEEQKEKQRAQIYANINSEAKNHDGDRCNSNELDRG